jgi:putative DNA primase/helicase
MAYASVDLDPESNSYRRRRCEWKSIFLSLLQCFIGRCNVSALSLHRIESDKFAVAGLVGKLANICSDLPTVKLSGSSMFKAITGGDTITGERKFKPSFEFRPYSRLVFSANSTPRSDDTTYGFFRRWLLIPFDRTFSDTDACTVPRSELDARLAATSELSGMLNKALDALPQVQSGAFRESASMKAAWDDFRCTTDPLAAWLESNTIEVPGAVMPKQQLRTLYGQSCLDAGRAVPFDNQFTAALRRFRPGVVTTERRLQKTLTKVFVGIGMKTDQQWPLEY